MGRASPPRVADGKRSLDHEDGEATRGAPEVVPELEEKRPNVPR
jgi:hypothetical protein